MDGYEVFKSNSDVKYSDFDPLQLSPPVKCGFVNRIIHLNITNKSLEFFNKNKKTKDISIPLVSIIKIDISSYINTIIKI